MRHAHDESRKIPMRADQRMSERLLTSPVSKQSRRTKKELAEQNKA
jgi:hypothetical protein